MDHKDARPKQPRWRWWRARPAPVDPGLSLARTRMLARMMLRRMYYLSAADQRRVLNSALQIIDESHESER